MGEIMDMPLSGFGISWKKPVWAAARSMWNGSMAGAN